MMLQEHHWTRWHEPARLTHIAQLSADQADLQAKVRWLEERVYLFERIVLGMIGLSLVVGVPVFLHAIVPSLIRLIEP